MIKKVKKYISENKILKVSLIIFSLICFVMISRLAIQEKKESTVRSFRIQITYKDQTKKLINRDYIKDEVRKQLGYDVSRIKVKDLELTEIERLLKNNNYVDEAEVYMDGRNVLNAEIVQKNPIVRVNIKKSGYYLDENGDFVALSPVAAVRVPVITGDVVAFDKNYRKDSLNQFNAIYALAKRIYDDPFLEALVEQIHVDGEGKYLLIPKLGKEKIILGSVEDLDQKVYKIKQFYKEGLTRVGWGKYAYLDVQYDKQVTAGRN